MPVDFLALLYLHMVALCLRVAFVLAGGILTLDFVVVCGGGLLSLRCVYLVIRLIGVIVLGTGLRV